jgi:hypothetical protein
VELLVFKFSSFSLIIPWLMQEEEKRLKNEGRETLEETVQKLISKAGSHMESTLIGNSV